MTGSSFKSTLRTTVRQLPPCCHPISVAVTFLTDFFFFMYATVDIDSETNYPPILVTTSTRDDRVHPGHARKFVKVRACTRFADPADRNRRFPPACFTLIALHFT